MQTFYLDIASSTLRVIFTVYFTVLSILIGFVGNACLDRANRRRQARGRPIPIYRTTSWLSSFSIFDYLYKTRHLPGGWMGWLMILSSAIYPVGHILVSNYISTVYRQGQCGFDTGLVIAQSVSFFSDHYSEPVSSWLPARWATDAQTTSARNGGLTGIYWKANDDPLFSAVSDDVAGKWNCVDMNSDKVYPVGTGTGALIDDLTSQGLQYDNVFPYVWQKPNDVEVGAVIWSVPITEDDRKPWDVKISVNTQLDPTKKVNMKNFHCSMSSTSIPWMLSYIDAPYALKGWSGNLFGSLGNAIGDRDGDMSGKMEMVLNAIVMVGGSGNGANHTASEAKSPFQGCLVAQAQLPVAVTIATAITGVMLISLVLFLVGLRLATPVQHPSDVPNGLVDYQKQALREAARNGNINARQAVCSDVRQVMIHLPVGGAPM